MNGQANIFRLECWTSLRGSKTTPGGVHTPTGDPLALATNTFLFSQPTAQNNNTNFQLHEISWVIIIAASHQRGSTLFLPHLFSLVPVPSPELCIANSKIDLFVVHSFGMIHLLTSQILRRVYEFTWLSLK